MLWCAYALVLSFYACVMLCQSINTAEIIPIEKNPERSSLVRRIGMNPTHCIFWTFGKKWWTLFSVILTIEKKLWSTVAQLILSLKTPSTINILYATLFYCTIKLKKMLSLRDIGTSFFKLSTPFIWVFSNNLSNLYHLYFDFQSIFRKLKGLLNAY